MPWFVRSECEEAGIRAALNDAAPLYRDAPEVHVIEATWDSFFDAFMKEVLPGVPTTSREQAGDLIATTLLTVAKEFSGNARSPEDIRSRADAMVDMFSAYLRTLNLGL